MTPRLDIEVSGGVLQSLRARSERTGQSLDRIVDTILSEGLELQRHSIFQVSTSNALVKGVFEGSTTVGDLRRHGDFGLGTFDALDGEMVMLDGQCHRASAGGTVTVAADELEVPFALVTFFEPDEVVEFESGMDLVALTDAVDALRPSENLFVAIRVDGEFEALSMRAACRARPGEGLVEATSHQSEFNVADAHGTLVGFWVPEYASTMSVPGYHFHFLSDDRSLGGHVLGMTGGGLTLRAHTETELHVSLPETEEFLAADLRGEFVGELGIAETGRRSS